MIKVGDTVKVKWVEKLMMGIVIEIAPMSFDYPIIVKMSDGNVSRFTEQQLEVI